MESINVFHFQNLVQVDLPNCLELSIAIKVKRFRRNRLGEPNTLSHSLMLKSLFQKQEKYGLDSHTTEVLEKFQIKKTRYVATPIDVSTKLTKSEKNSEPFNQEIFQSAIRCLLCQQGHESILLEM